MKAYMGYSRGGGAQEGAVLIFAHSAREAKKVAWGGILSDICDGEYTDAAVRLLKKEGFDEANQEKLSADIPHVIDNPRTCKGCEMWGVDIQENGYCIDCNAKDERIPY